MRLVADTNTVVSGLLWQGPPRQLLDAAFARRLRLYTSAALLAELAEVLGRAKFARKVAASTFSAEELMWRYARLARHVTPAAIEPVVRADPDDDHVLACAIAARAELIVSGDRHLLALGEYQGIRIVGASAALALIEAAK